MVQKYNLLVSIITPTLNSESFVGDNIKSIRGQTYPYIQHVVIDGGSTDKTLSIVNELEPTAIVISEPDEGISDAFNKGLKVASGDVVATLNSDDYYIHSDVIQKVVDVFKSKPEIMFLYGRVRTIDADTGRTLVIYGEPFSLKKLKKEIIIPHPAVFARREVYEKVGQYSLEYKICMDHDFFLRVANFYEPHYFDEILTVMRWGGVSTRNIYCGHREAYRIFLSNGVPAISALMNIFYRYTFTTLSLILQKTGFTNLILWYRKKKGRL